MVNPCQSSTSFVAYQAVLFPNPYICVIFPHPGSFLVSPNSLPMFFPMVCYKLSLWCMYIVMLYVTYLLAICFANLIVLHLSPWRVSLHPAAVSSFQCCWPPRLFFPTHARGCICAPVSLCSLPLKLRNPWEDLWHPLCLDVSLHFILAFSLAALETNC